MQRKIRQKTRFCARMCLLGVIKPNLKTSTSLSRKQLRLGPDFDGTEIFAWKESQHSHCCIGLRFVNDISEKSLVDWRIARRRYDILLLYPVCYFLNRPTQHDRLLSHSCTTVRMCFKDDDESLWGMSKFDPPPSSLNPLTDWHLNDVGDTYHDSL